MATDVRKLAQDAAYVAVGVGVLAVQRAQVARREARARLEAQIKDTRLRVGSTVTEVQSRVEPVRTKILTRIEPLLGVTRGNRS
ncbi:MAG: hypothetical protein HYU28_04565 [Actinobacteria bacterium]|nr:hypothetical protein [Actinomycetota bacterium]